MVDHEKKHGEGIEPVRGLEMFAATDSQALEEEKSKLAQLSNKGFLRRWAGYSRMTGPGWLQSALTLGAGSAVTSLFAGAYLQYGLLWVQPVAMILGIIMLAAISHQTLSTRARPFSVISLIFHPVVAWVWAFEALAVTVIWHFPQYALAAGMAEDMIKATTGWQPSPAGQTMLLIGFGLGNLVSIFTGFKVSVPMDWAIIGLVFCTAIGLIFGLWPAYKASALNPVESLRYE